MLPFLILSAGYNMKRRRFFRNIGSIFLFGVLGTILCFILIGLGAISLSEAGAIIDEDGGRRTISAQEALTLGAVLSASDVVCALSIIKEKATPRLHSILFGEAVVNDAIGILLYKSLQSMNISSIDTGTVFLFIGEFLYNCFTSIALGIVMGLITSFLSRIFKELRTEPAHQTALLFYMAWSAYVLAELFGISGVICMLMCTIVMGHYAWYNLTDSAREVSSEAFKFLGNGAEALIFAYLGLTAVSYFTDVCSFYFILAMVLFVMAARLFSTFGLAYLFKLLTCFKYDMPSRTVGVVWMAGTIRGAVAFALVVEVDSDEAELLKATVIGIVIFTTLVFGTFLPIWIKIVKPNENVSNINNKRGEMGSSLDMTKFFPRSQSRTHFLNTDDVLKKKSWIHRVWRNFDDKRLKPCLIDKDELRKQKENQNELVIRAEQSVDNFSS